MTKKAQTLLLQFAVIVLMSVVSSYAFQHTVTTYQIHGLCFYRYVAYAVTVFLVYICFSPYKKRIGLVFSLLLSAVALSPIGLKAIELFPLATPFFAVLMGIVTVLAIPRAGGTGFFAFVTTLILPAVLAESRIRGSVQLIASIESVGYYELVAITICVVGGCFYLRYAALANFSCLQLAANGGNEDDVAEVSERVNIMNILIAIGASGLAAFLMTTAPIFAGALRDTVVALPLHVTVLAIGAGIALTTAFYIFQLSQRRRMHRRAQRR